MAQKSWREVFGVDPAWRGNIDIQRCAREIAIREAESPEMDEQLAELVAAHEAAKRERGETR